MDPCEPILVLDLSDLAFLTVPLAEAPVLHLSRGLNLTRAEDRSLLRGGAQTLELHEGGAAALEKACALTDASFLGLSGKVGFLLSPRPPVTLLKEISSIEAMIRPSSVLRTGCVLRPSE